MHPSVVLCVWLGVVLLLQKLPIEVGAAMVVLGATLSGRRVLDAWFRLLRRSRWLIAVLVLTFLLMTPGESLWPGAPATFEGARQAAEHGGRLVAVLFAVAWLVGGRPMEDLVAALWGIAAALRARVLETAVIRLALTLRSAASGPAGRWRDLLAGGNELPEDAPVLRFDARPLGPAGVATCCGAVAVTAAVWCLLP